MSTIWIRGAITTEENSKQEILEKTTLLLNEILEKNNIELGQVTSILFTATKDLDKAYPAVAARNLGFTEAALLCFQEMYVEGSLSRCIRVAVIVNVDGKSQTDSHAVYLGEAVKLRPDLQK